MMTFTDKENQNQIIIIWTAIMILYFGDYLTSAAFNHLKSQIIEKVYDL